MFNDDFGQKKINDLRSLLLELILTFNFTSENIALKPNEWTIITLFLIHLYVTFLNFFLSKISSKYFRLTLKIPILSSSFIESKIIKSLLTTLNLSSDMILHIVKYLLENPIIQTTNFEEID